jgi:cold shock CspA family protein
MVSKKIYATSAMGIGGFLIARMEGHADDGYTGNHDVFVPATAFHRSALPYITPGATLIADIEHNPHPDQTRAQYRAAGVHVIITQARTHAGNAIRPRDRKHTDIDGSYVAKLMWFNEARGFGFVRLETRPTAPMTASPTAFVHRQDVQRAGIDSLKARETYEVVLKVDTDTNKFSVREIRVKE